MIPQPPAAANSPGRPKNKTPYHGAAVNVISYRLHEYKENGDVEIIDEHRLSKEPLRIDVIVVKKNRDVVLNLVWALIFRLYNIIEYKSPIDGPPTLEAFSKLIGYAWIYAAQEGVSISDMTATLICARTPRKLFKRLREEFGYEILEKTPGIYYITEKGAPAEKRLAVQVVVQKSDPLLHALDKESLDEATISEAAKVMCAAAKKNGERLGYWVKALSPENMTTIIERMESNMNREKAFQEALKSLGLTETSRLDEVRQESLEEGLQKGRQEGLQKGLRKGLHDGRQEGLKKGLRKGLHDGRQEGAQKVIALLEQGYSLAAAKKKLRLT